MSGQLFIISSPSGGGKSTITAALLQRVERLGYSVSHTSRMKRGTEEEGLNYYFVDRNTFKNMIDAGAFMEWAEVYGDFYGTSYSSVEKITSQGLDVVLDVDSQGAKNIKKQFNECVLIYLLPPSLKILEKRLRERGTDSQDVIQKRLKKAEEEIVDCLWYDHIIINDNLEKAIDEARAVIISQRTRSSRIESAIENMFGKTFRK